MMWDLESPLNPWADNLVSRTLATSQIDLSGDERIGVYTVTETAGYAPFNTADFITTCNISLAVLCFLPWLPPPLKIGVVREFIIQRRHTLFEGAEKEPMIRAQIAARVIRPGFEAMKSGRRDLTPFDLFNFA
jgi:hypothetical protein